MVWWLVGSNTVFVAGLRWLSCGGGWRWVWVCVVTAF